MTYIPSPLDVRVLLEDLLARGVEVRPSDPWAPLGGAQGTYALYVDDVSMVRSVTVCDLAFSAYAGAAIGLLPPAAAQDAVEDKDLSETMRDNLSEVLNVCAALQNQDGHPHLRLYVVHHIGLPVPHEIPPLAAVLGRRLDLEVTIAGYGTGRLSLVGLG